MVTIEVNNATSKLIGYLHQDPSVNTQLHEAVRQELSYEVPSAEWSQKYKQGQWDGRISLYNKRITSFPSGLVRRVRLLFEKLEIEYQIVDAREKPERNYPVTCDFEGKQLRFYQENAATLSKKSQRGMLSLCTGAGKTMTSCKIFENLAVAPVVFIVPAIELLKQTQKEFQRYLRFNNQKVEIGIAGGGLCNLNMKGINVITYQTALIAFDKKYIEKSNKVVDDPNVDGPKSTAQLQKELDEANKKLIIANNNATRDLAKLSLDLEHANKLIDKETDLKKKKTLASAALSLDKQYNKELNALIKIDLAAYKKALAAWDNRQETLLQKSQVRNLISSCNAFIVDEAHVASVVIEELGKQAKNAYYRLGLSGTPWRMDNQEIRIEGTLGRKIIEVSASDLIELGFLVPPKIFVCNVSENNGGETYPDIYSNNIVNNWERNYRIKEFAEGFKAAGRPTLILVERREHGDILEGMIEDAVFVPGGDKGVDDPTDEEKNYRRRMLNAVENNEIVLIATQWANVGVDAPKIATLILAGSNQSSVTTYQQVGRVLRCVGPNIEVSKQNNKPDAIIIDFMLEQKNLKSHCNMRKKVYRNERAWSLYQIK